MTSSGAALIVIDAQQSFRHRPYWSDEHLPAFIQNLQTLIDGAGREGVPVVQVFHVEESGDFALNSGYVTALAELSIRPDVIFYKRRHSALVGSGLEAWLLEHAIQKLIISGIRTEQCCETTSRHASDLGFEVDYVTEATLTFGITDRHGRSWSAEEIKARTELVLDGRFARIVSVSEALAACVSEPVA